MISQSKRMPACAGRVGARGRLLLLILAGATLLPAAPAVGIIGGQVDGTGHPYVGAVDVRPTGRTIPGSGTLISPTVYLTAGHVTTFFDQAGVSRARVTFDPVFSDSATFYTGTVHTNPAFTKREDDPGDLGVIVFDQPVQGITPAQLPTQGLLDQLGPQGLQGEAFTTVGYGISRLLGGANGGGTPRPDRSSAGTRKVALESFLSLTPGWLRLLMHEDGQACTGDSGAPTHVGDGNLVVAISIAGDVACESMDAHVRLDTRPARAFLGQYVTLP